MRNQLFASRFSDTSAFRLLFAVLFFTALLISGAHADITIPHCEGDRGEALPVMNSQALDWKQSKPNQFKERALLQGTFVAVTVDRDSHYQFSIQIGPDAKKDLVEVIYNKAFGNFPKPFVGMKVSACGDFINASHSAAGYPASPAGAIIHWVHLNPGDRGSKHPSGFIVMNGTLVGQDYSGGENNFEANSSQNTERSPLNGFFASTPNEVLGDSETR